MKTQPTHTPTPWCIDPVGPTIINDKGAYVADCKNPMMPERQMPNAAAAAAADAERSKMKLKILQYGISLL